MHFSLLLAILPLLGVAVPLKRSIVIIPRHNLTTVEDFRRMAAERRNAANGTASVRPVHRYNQLAWPFTIGTPGADRFLVFDTTSTDTFLASNELLKTGIDIKNSKTAVTLDNNYSLQKYGAHLRGDTVRDVLQWGWFDIQTSGEFGLIHRYEGAEEAVLPNQIGMGWRPNAQKSEDSSAPLIHGFFKSGLGGDGLYQVFVTRTQFAIHLGGESLCVGEASYFDVLRDKPVPMVQADSFKLDKFEDSHSYPLTFDSSVGAVMLPAGSYNYAIKRYNPKFDPETGLFLVDCDTDRSNKWEFTIGGKSVQLDDNDLIYKSEFAENKCALMVAKDLNAEPQYVLGTPAFGKYCITFDVKNNKIGVKADPRRVA